MSGPLPIYQSHLGLRFGLLPPEVRCFHSLRGNIRLDGAVAIKGAGTFLGRIAAFVVRLPAESNRQAFVFEMRADARQEIWTRRFVSRTMRSTLSLRGPYLTESFGPIRLWFKLEATEKQLTMLLQKVTCFGVTLPARFVPAVSAIETGQAGQFRFNIEARWPGNHLFVAYEGTLGIGEREATA
jgi:hypothetical protein